MELIGPQYTYNSTLWYPLLGGGLTQDVGTSSQEPLLDNIFGKPNLFAAMPDRGEGCSGSEAFSRFLNKGFRVLQCWAYWNC